jgi:hypothetical protein
MRTFNINGTDIELDEDVEYCDFFVEDGQPKFLQMRMHDILGDLESGKMEWEYALPNIKLMSRWVNEAPRKRHYRKLKLEGYSVVSSEYFFENYPQGDEFIDALERTGKVAEQILAAYGEEPVPPIQQDDPDRLATIEEILDGGDCRQ